MHGDGEMALHGELLIPELKLRLPFADKLLWK